MPDTTLSEALAEAYASAPTDVVVLHTLEFRHPDFVTPIRVVSDTEDLVATLEADAPEDPATAVTFQAFAWNMRLPDVAAGSFPTLEIEIDNVSQEIEDALEAAAQSSETVEVTYRPYLSDDLTAPSMDPPLTLELLTARANLFKVRATAGYANLMNRQFPREDYTLARFPGLVR